MKKSVLILGWVAMMMVMVSCKNAGNGQLVGVENRPEYVEVVPFGMKNIPYGHFLMGGGEADPAYSQTYAAKNVTVQAFWMDETEITNNEYRQFVMWVRDSIAHVLLGDAEVEDENEHYLKYRRGENEGDVIEPKRINWRTPIYWDSEDEEYQAVLENLYSSPAGNDRYYHYKGKDLNVKMLNFEYWWTDRRAYRDPEDPEVMGAAYKEFDNNDPSTKEMGMFSNRPTAYNQGKKPFLRREVVNIYPDTLCWIHDFTYSFNDPLTDNYFSHPQYDWYPVVGVNWKQARAFCAWRTQLRNTYLSSRDWAFENEFRLPNEVEWEWAARCEPNNPYPWGGPYPSTRNGCFLANYKPQRGNYGADGGVQTIIVAHYHPNDWGLYDMAGNVSEWCEDAYNESAYNFGHDLNMVYTYYAKESDPPTMKRKVVRGGSWKDISYYMQNAVRSFCYQDTGKSYIGFRCVQTYLGRNYGDSKTTSSNIY